MHLHARLESRNTIPRVTYQERSQGRWKTIIVWYTAESNAEFDSVIGHCFKSESYDDLIL